MEYKREAFTMFENLMTSIKQDISAAVFRTTTSAHSFGTFLSRALPRTLVHEDVALLGRGAQDDGADQNGGGRMVEEIAGGMLPEAPRAGARVQRDAPKVGRNDPCPCGSGKKYKKCCGA